ncbi:TrbG/VirB9 family P-type conjugative transfer protein [Sphingosinicella sp. BN140058]|uniref:TrbG/VirB9 family P-type conjugative transfer protein n=1 Tax=Sphingosinicella sp. BN140058 TaxID=1892855 RepID=UPI0010110384|nr:TrbG/VirB9 family P-type conjugative transfer protein [Sphingosinicella sp. BN140058]QAY77677.1 type VI secretion protein [Sphingosinicella sp. BN140058]
MPWIRAIVPLSIACAAVAASPLAAQLRPVPGPGDPHIQFVDYVSDQVIVLEATPGYQMMIELAPDERVENVAVGDSAAWQVSANRNGNALFVKALTGGVSTNMTAITNVRVYSFELSPVTTTGNLAYTIRFRYPQTGAESEARNAEGEGRYRLRGKKALLPSEMSDDGVLTYIRWPRERSLPAVYAVSDTGKEMLVNGMMREDDVFVIDGVSGKLVFRIDKEVATATRQRMAK